MPELSPTQHDNALGIIRAARSLPGLTEDEKARVADIAIETALTESGMRMIASANVPASQRYPHEKLSWTSDGLGHDHASMGMFQQQTGYRWARAGTSTLRSPDGWGTQAELMDAEISTRKFLHALMRVDWRHMTNWAAAQAVQRSAFSDGSNYREQDARAISIRKALWHEAGEIAHTQLPTPKPTPEPRPRPAPRPEPTPRPQPPHRTYTVKPGDNLTAIALRYPEPWITADSIARANHLPDPDRIFPGQVLVIA